jgi:hypothetical protein
VTTRCAARRVRDQRAWVRCRGGDVCQGRHAGLYSAGAVAARLYEHHPRRHAGPAAATGIRFILSLTRAARTGEGGPAVEVPLDGTVYDLDTGRVLEWCPRNNPVRVLLGSLKVRDCGTSCSVHAAWHAILCASHVGSCEEEHCIGTAWNEAICEQPQAERSFCFGECECTRSASSSSWVIVAVRDHAVCEPSSVTPGS